MHPSAKKKSGYVNQQAAPFQRPPKKACPGGLAVTGLGKECTLLPREGQSPSSWTFIFTDGHVQCSRIRWGRPAERQKAKTKGSDAIQRRIAQGDNLQITKLGDDQERRPTPSQVAQNERERVIGQHEEKTQWMTTARKVQQRKPAPPMRKNRPEQENTKKIETASKTGANQKTYP